MSEPLKNKKQTEDSQPKVTVLNPQELMASVNGKSLTGIQSGDEIDWNAVMKDIESNKPTREQLIEQARQRAAQALHAGLVPGETIDTSRLAAAYPAPMPDASQTPLPADMALPDYIVPEQAVRHTQTLSAAQFAALTAYPARREVPEQETGAIADKPETAPPAPDAIAPEAEFATPTDSPVQEDGQQENGQEMDEALAASLEEGIREIIEQDFEAGRQNSDEAHIQTIDDTTAYIHEVTTELAARHAAAKDKEDDIMDDKNEPADKANAPAQPDNTADEAAAVQPPQPALRPRGVAAAQNASSSADEGEANGGSDDTGAITAPVQPDTEPQSGQPAAKPKGLLARITGIFRSTAKPEIDSPDIDEQAVDRARSDLAAQQADHTLHLDAPFTAPSLEKTVQEAQAYAAVSQASYNAVKEALDSDLSDAVPSQETADESVAQEQPAPAGNQPDAPIAAEAPSESSPPIEESAAGQAAQEDSALTATESVIAATEAKAAEPRVSGKRRTRVPNTGPQRGNKSKTQQQTAQSGDSGGGMQPPGGNGGNGSDGNNGGDQSPPEQPKKTQSKETRDAAAANREQGAVAKSINLLTLDEFKHDGVEGRQKNYTTFWNALTKASHGSFEPHYALKKQLRNIAEHYKISTDANDYHAPAVLKHASNDNIAFSVDVDGVSYTGSAPFGPAEARAMIALEISRASASGKPIKLYLDPKASDYDNFLLAQAAKEYKTQFNLPITVVNDPLETKKDIDAGKVRKALDLTQRVVKDRSDNKWNKDLRKDNPAYNQALQAYADYQKDKPLADNKNEPEIIFVGQDQQSKDALLKSVLGADKKLRQAAEWIIAKGTINKLQKEFGLTKQEADKIKAKLVSRGLLFKSEHTSEKTNKKTSRYNVLIGKDGSVNFEKIAQLSDKQDLGDALGKAFRLAAARDGINAVDVARKDALSIEDAKRYWKQVAFLKENAEEDAADEPKQDEEADKPDQDAGTDKKSASTKPFPAMTVTAKKGSSPSANPA